MDRTAQPTTFVVEGRKLRKQFGEFVAVNDISFQVSFGQCFGILGPNGAGKTTTIRMMYGFSPLTGGMLNVFGMDITTHWRKIRSRIGVCQQENTLDPDLTVQQNLELFARYFDVPKGEAQHRARKLLDFIALQHRRDSAVSELSGGMIRRVVLARSLINEPDLLILDEPTTGLDPQARHLIWEKLESLKRSGLSILLTTHNMDEAERLCDSLIIMDHGSILVEGRPRDLVHAHVGENVLEVMEPPAELRAYLDAQAIHYESLEHRLLIYRQRDDALFQDLSNRYCAGGCLLRMGTLEDVFLRLTGRGLRE